jgi:hypothetical protein
VIDQLEAVDEPGRDYDSELQTLEALWMERPQPYGDKGYHSHAWRPGRGGTE